MTIERRTALGTVEFREDGDRLVARGYAAVFESLSKDLGGFVERIAPGAFDRVLNEGQDVVALANHDPNLVLGRSGSGTLRLRADDVGLGYEVDLPNTATGRDWAELLRRRDVVGSSFGFRVAVDGDEWGTDADERPLRTIRSVAVVRDVGPVTFPAYGGTEAALRSLDAALEAIERTEPEEPAIWVPRTRAIR